MKAKILVADDSITIQKIVAMSFEKEDVVVEGVSDGKQAYEKLAQIKPDIVLADTDMPGMTGYQLSQKIKESKEFSNVRVLLLTSDFEDFNEALYKSSKADGRISKPFKSDEIIKIVNETLEDKTDEVLKRVNNLLLNVQSGIPPAESEVLTLSSSDIVDDADLPQAILLEEDAIVPTVELSVSDMVEDTNPYAVSAPESSNTSGGDINFDDIFGEEFAAAEKDSTFSEKDTVPEDSAIIAGIAKDMEDQAWPPPEFFAPESPEDKTSAQVVQPEKVDGSGVLDEIVSDLENLKSTKQVTAQREPADTESLAETERVREDSLDDLDKAFMELKKNEPAPVAQKQKLETREPEPAVSSRMSRARSVEPEPENLLEKMAPSAFSRQGELRPDLIRESLDFLSESDVGKKNGQEEVIPTANQMTNISRSFEPMEGKLNMMLGDHINAILEKSLSSAIQSEVSGLSDIIMRSVREIVREVTPHIAREIIKEEIEKIRDGESV